MSDLSKSAEEVFHDQWASSADLDKISIRAAFESESSPENRQILAWMGDLRGKSVLELGAGLGEASVYFATKGAKVTATDLSTGMLSVASRLANRHGVTLETVQASAMDLDNIPDNSFDIVYAANLLHHVDVEKCIQASYKKLKKGGSAYFWDPIHYNPVIQVYRRMAMQVRTEDEHPLKVQDIRSIQGAFGNVETQFFWLTGLSVFLKFFLWDRIHPNSARYWKKILEDCDSLEKPLRWMHWVDRGLICMIPGLKWLCWNIVIRVRKD